MRIINNRMKLFLLALPFVLLVFVFNYIPLFGWVFSFFDYKPGIPLTDSEFVGLKYFALAFESGGGELLRVLTNTLVISFLGILVSPLNVIFAVLLNEIRLKSFKKVVQTLTTLPNFISWVLVYAIFFVFFSVNDGFVNQALLKLGFIDTATNMLGNNGAVWFFQTFVSVWKSLGWGAIIYLAAITSIDPELYDAAEVDGAGRYRKIVHITVPGILPTYLVMLLLSASNMLSNGFEQFYVFYNPQVAENIEVLDYYLYRIGILGSDFSYSTALGMFKSVISIAILFTVNWIAKKVRGESLI